MTGVSWYEAAAYASFKGHALPTAFHWYWVAAQGLTGFVIPFGNFNSAAPVPVAETRALHRFGAYGLAGNVKEWTFNEAPGHRRYTLGGGWNEPPYMFRDTDARSSFDRGPNMGFRTVKYDQGDQTVAAVSGVLMPPSRNYATEKPVGDAVFEAYRRLYLYDSTELAPKVESIDDANPDWRLERVTFTAAYGQERVTVLFVPTEAGPAPVSNGAVHARVPRMGHAHDLRPSESPVFVLGQKRTRCGVSDLQGVVRAFRRRVQRRRQIEVHESLARLRDLFLERHSPNR